MTDFPGEGRVAETQFSIGDRGFVLSGDGDNHGSMLTGEFWEYDYQSDSWAALPPHPRPSRWAPESFTIGNVVYFLAGEVRPGNPNPGLKNDLWSFDLDATASIADNSSLDAIVLFPNPATSKIQLQGVPENTEISLVTSTGQLVWKQPYSGSTIDVSSIESGLYFVTIEVANGNTERIKFIKH
jgi:hypothetical protein